MIVENPCKDCIKKGTMSCNKQACLRYSMYMNGPKFGFNQDNKEMPK